jgi:hypothetical protein
MAPRSKTPDRGGPDGPSGPSDTPDPPSAAPQPPAAPPGDTPSPLGELFLLDATTADNNVLQDIVNRQVRYITTKHQLAFDHNVLFLFDSGSISRSDANRVYSGVSAFDSDKPLLLIVNSTGGDVASAYFIATERRDFPAFGSWSRRTFGAGSR